MKETRILMGMPVTVEVGGDLPADRGIFREHVGKIFAYFSHIDRVFSTYKPESEITRINQGRIAKQSWSEEMKTVFLLSEKTRQETDGYFDIVNNQGLYDPSGLVKGWAIRNAADLLYGFGYHDFYVEAGGDIQVAGANARGGPWAIGIRNPFHTGEIVKTVTLAKDEGIATSGTYERGAHVYNPKDRKRQLAEIVSITVIGSDAYEADRFATAAFAMQRQGIYFIEKMPGLEAYMIDKNGVATMTSNFTRYAAA